MVGVNRKARPIWAAKHSINKRFYAYSRQREAPMVLQMRAHAQTTYAYKRTGYSRESGQSILVKTGHQFYIAPYGNMGGKTVKP